MLQKITVVATSGYCGACMVNYYDVFVGCSWGQTSKDNRAKRRVDIDIEISLFLPFRFNSKGLHS